jgi:hypothetical protein
MIKPCIYSLQNNISNKITFMNIDQSDALLYAASFLGNVHAEKVPDGAASSEQRAASSEQRAVVRF